MQIPDLQQYKDKFSQEAFTDKIARIAKRSGAKLVYAALVLYYTLQSDNVSLKDKAIIVGALGYLISPIDVIPDAIPIAGLTDDLSVPIYVINKVWNNVGDDVKQKAHEKLKTWFDEESSRLPTTCSPTTRWTTQSDLMTAGHIIILLAVLAAVAYLGYRVKRAFEAIHDPCRGCPGCALKGKISGRERHRMRKKQCEEIKNAQKFGGIK